MGYILLYHLYFLYTSIYYFMGFILLYIYIYGSRPKTHARILVSGTGTIILDNPHIYIYIYIYIWVNYNDLTVLPHWNSWLVRGIIPKWPNYSG